jgi:hypothetical protein
MNSAESGVPIGADPDPTPNDFPRATSKHCGHLSWGSHFGAYSQTIDVKKRQDTANLHPEAVFAHKFIDNQVLAESVFRIGEYVADHGIMGPGAYRAARDILLKTAPRLREQAFEQAGELSLATAMRAALSLDQSVFPVQGRRELAKPTRARA